MREPAPMAPLARSDCPLCGRPNGCAVAASGRFETPCWCTEASFAPELLERIPVAERGRSCVCAACAAAALSRADPSAPGRGA